MADPLAPIFNFLRPHLKDGWNDLSLIEGFKRELKSLGVTIEAPAAPPPPTPAPAPAGPHGLADEPAFFNAIRGSGLFRSGLSQPQVDGIKAKVAAFASAGWPIGWAAYGLATSYHETAHTMQPIEEIGKGRGKRYGAPGPHGGQIAYGRGDVQLTWQENYAKADADLGLGGALIANYALALRPDISARIMISGMSKGWFTGKKLRDYLPDDREGAIAEFTQARRIINGTDRAADLANYALKFQAAFKAGGWR
jgi:hypothetical protein